MLKRTHTCGELTAENEGQTVILNGWVDTRRDHGGLIFIDLRDRYGLTQVVFEPDAGKALMDSAHDLRGEFVIGVKGVVSKRLEGKNEPQAQDRRDRDSRRGSGSPATAPPPRPFEIASDTEPNEELRLTYRYLDLRRPSMQKIFLLRHQHGAADAEHDVRPGVRGGRNADAGAEHA